MTYKNWLKNWLNLYVKPTVTPRTFVKYKRQIEIHVLPALGSYELSKLTPQILQNFTVNLSKKGFAPNTVNGVISVVKSSLKRATLLELTAKEHSNSIVRPKQREKQISCLTKTEQRKIELYVLSSNRPNLIGIIISLYTGLRVGELIALTWSDVNLSKGLISITKSCHDSWVNGAYYKIIDSPKTNSSTRVIPIPKRLITILKDLKKLSLGEYVVPGKSPYGAQVRSYQKTFELLLNQLKLSHKGIHSLRHTFATRALECGMDVKTLSEILGHKNPAVTLSRYAHSLIEHKTEMMNRLNKLLP